MQFKKSYLSLSFLFFLSPILSASELAPDGNLREACRKYVGGLYLKKYDYVEKLTKTLQHLKSQNFRLKKRLKKINQQSPIIDPVTDHLLFDPKKIKQKRAYDLEKGMILSNIKVNEKILLQTQKVFASSQEELVKVKEKILKVFSIYKFNAKKNKPIYGYRFKVVYQDSCPRFYVSCPLPKNKTSFLREIFFENNLPVVCDRYASKRLRKKNSHNL